MAAQVLPKRLRLLTLNLGDVPLDGLRDACRAGMNAAKRTFAKLRVPGHAVKVEAPQSRLDNGAFHPHLHAIVDVPLGGRNFIPAHAWTDTFFDQLPNGLHPGRDYAHLSGVLDSVFASATYVTKSAYHGADTADVPRIIAATQATAGLRHFVTAGSLRIAA